MCHHCICQRGVPVWTNIVLSKALTNTRNEPSFSRICMLHVCNIIRNHFSMFNPSHCWHLSPLLTIAFGTSLASLSRGLPDGVPYRPSWQPWERPASDPSSYRVSSCTFLSRRVTEVDL